MKGKKRMPKPDGPSGLKMTSGEKWAKEATIRFHRNLKNGVEVCLAEGLDPRMTLGELLEVLGKKIEELEDGKKD